MLERMTEAPAAADVLERAVADARRAHPDLGASPEAFSRHLRERLGMSGSSALAHGGDLYLAFACGVGNRAALARFEADFVSQVPAFVAHLRLDANSIEELLQALRVRLLTPAPGGGGAKILDYSGKGPLGGWLRVSAVRLALNGKKPSRESKPDELAALASAAEDPELGLVRGTASQAIKHALQESLAALDADTRTALRMCYVDGLSIDQIGLACGVHRATAARWLAAGREKVGAAVRARLRAELKLHERHEIDSLLALVDSQLDASLSRVLRRRTPDAG